MKKFTFTAVALSMSVVLAGCTAKPQSSQSATEPATSTAPAATTTETPASAGEITISDFKFGPETLTVKAGSTVRVTNKDASGHSVTSSDDKSFDTGILSQGKSAEFTAPTTPGTYEFSCIAHPSMKGKLIVQ